MKKFNRSKLFLIICIAFLGFTVVGCNKNSDPVSSSVSIHPQAGMDLYGFIGDVNGNPVKGVVVSDGYTCTVTDSTGVYQMKKNSSADFVFYSVPASYKADPSSFYQKLASNSQRYDFSLEKSTVDETNFNLLCIGDPQVSSTTEVNRFKNETMVDIKAFVDSSTFPSYGLSLGDMVGDRPNLQTTMKTLISSTKMPVFVTVGNHDKVAYADTKKPRNCLVYCSTFGPLNYSFNRGNVHFVCLDDVLYSNASDYNGGFSDSQVEWLREDLSYVPKTDMVIVYYHIPLRNSSSIVNRTNILNLLNGFAEVHLMAGHTHYIQNYSVTTPISVYEHIHGAACGAWWHSTINGDGTPNGFAVYSISGNTIKNWYYKAVHYNKNFQIRLHWGNVKFGGTCGYYSYGQTQNTLVANIWNADSKWTVNVYENGVFKGMMTRASSIKTDAWSQGYHIGILGRDASNYSEPNYHTYIYQVADPTAKITVEAIDGFGNKYTQSDITSSFSTAEAYQ